MRRQVITALALGTTPVAAKAVEWSTDRQTGFTLHTLSATRAIKYRSGLPKQVAVFAHTDGRYLVYVTDYHTTQFQGRYGSLDEAKAVGEAVLAGKAPKRSAAVPVAPSGDTK